MAPAQCAFGVRVLFTPSALKKIRTFLALAGALMSASPALAQTLTPQARLRKLSLSVRGVLPDPAEYAVLQRTNAAKVDDFLAATAAKYVSTNEFYTKISFRILEDLSLYNLKDPGRTAALRLNFLKTGSLGTGLIQDFDITRLLALGMSWDEILKSAAIQNYNKAFTVSSHDNLLASIEKASAAGMNQNPMGLISSPDFMHRYVKTQYSKAAATYRIYLCDSMTPIAIGGKTISRDTRAGPLFASDRSAPATPAAPAAGVTSPSAHMAATAHVQPACAGCHVKLDPARDIIGGLRPFPIRFIYFDDKGEKQDFSASSQSDFLTQLTSQDQYYNCQVRKFWNWYIGEDVALSDAHKETLKAEYKKNSGNISKFVQTLVRLPEFYSSPDPKRQNQLAVQTIFRKCDQCHAGLPGGNVPKFAQMPFKGSHGEPVDLPKWIQTIAMAIDLGHLGENGLMPLKGAGWSLSESNFIDIARWIQGGAIDDDGRPGLTIDAAESILDSLPSKFRESLVLKAPKPSFMPMWKRYLENYDLLFVFDQLFGLKRLAEVPSAPEAPDHVACTQENLAAMAMESTYNLDDRKLKFQRPSEFYQTALESCTKLFTSKLLEGPPSSGFVRHQVDFPAYGLNLGHAGSQKWADIDTQKQKLMISSMIDALIGPGVLDDPAKTVLANRITSALALIDLKNAEQAVKSIIYYIVMRDEFASF